MTKATKRLLEVARRRAQEGLRRVALGTDGSPGADVVNIVQI